MIISAGTSSHHAGLQFEREAGFPYWTAGFFLSGSIEVTCEGRTLLFPPRSCLILGPNTPYRLTVLSKHREIWTIFDPRMRLHSTLPATDGRSRVISVIFGESHAWSRMRAGLNDLMHWWGSQPPELLLAENAVERLLLLAIRQHGLQQDQRIPDDRIHRVVAHIERRLGEELPIEELASVAGLSASRFAHLFQEAMGLSPIRFLEKHRIERAKYLLLTTDLPVQEIGRSCGFPNAQHFSVRFRNMTGQSPSAFRHLPKRRFRELHPEEDAPS
jgi:AraC-like DNA-binding protein